MKKLLIPKRAKRVFKGTGSDIYQWSQKMFDGTTKIFEVVIRPDGVTVIAEYKGKIVVQKQRQPHTDWYYSLPGGSVDKPRELLRTAALRELLEETGMKPKQLVLWKDITRTGRVLSSHHIYVAHNCSIVGEPKLDGGEEISLKFINFEQFLKLSDNPLFHGQDINLELLRARVNPRQKQKLKKAIFG